MELAVTANPPVCPWPAPVKRTLILVSSSRSFSFCCYDYCCTTKHAVLTSSSSSSSSSSSICFMFSSVSILADRCGSLERTSLSMAHLSHSIRQDSALAPRNPMDQSSRRPPLDRRRHLFALLARPFPPFGFAFVDLSSE